MPKSSSVLAGGFCGWLAFGLTFPLLASPALAQTGLTPVPHDQPPLFIAIVTDLWNRGVIEDRLIGIAASAVLGVLIGTLLHPSVRPALLRGIRNLILIALACLIVIGLCWPPPDGDTYTNLIMGLTVIVVAWVVMHLFLKPPPPKPRPTSFGSARWADYADLLQGGLCAEGGFRLGAFGAAPLSYHGDRHLLTVAPTRSGKGVCSIIPNLLTYEGSALVVDPKGENALITAKRRGAGSRNPFVGGMGQDIILLDPWDIAASKLGIEAARFNPLDWIDAEDPDVAENAFLLADALVVPSPGRNEDRFWDEEAKSLLTGIILYVATSPSEAANRTLGRVRDILTLSDSRMKEVFEEMYRDFHPVVRSTAARTAAKDSKLRSSVFASAQAHTHFLESPRIRQSLSKSDFQFETLKSKPATIYLILPADRLNTFGRWLRLLIQQAITVNARNIEATPQRPILFLLDEMAAIGHLPSVEQAYGLMAGFGMQMWGIVQDLSQLAKIYGEDGWQTFISNSGVLQYFGSRDQKTAEYFSALCGVTTVESETKSTAFSAVFGRSSSSGPGGGSSGSSSSESRTTTVGRNESQRKLAYADELMVLHRDEQIMIVENLDPIRATKQRWFEDTQLKALGINLKASYALIA